MTMTMLYEALPVAGQKHNRYCAPAALAAAAGINTGEAAALLRSVSGKRAIIRVAPRDLVEACTQAGLRLRGYVTLPDRPTFSEYVTHWHDGGLSILYVTGHFVAIAGTQYVDTFARRPSPLSAYPKQRQRVRAVINLQRNRGNAA